MNLCIIQARMGSTRLPGKVLKCIHNKPLIDHLLDRLAPSKHIDEFVVATSDLEQDDALVNHLEKRNTSVFRGSEWDVLERFYLAAKKHSPKTITRICADNPLHSYKVLDQVFERFLATQSDYHSNSNHEPDVLEDGFDVEVFSFAALEKAYLQAKLLSDREHVTPFIKRDESLKRTWQKTCEAYTYKLSVDTENDRLAVEQIFLAFKENYDFSIDQVVELLEHRSDILELNKESIINSGFHKSLKNDKIVK